MHYIILLLVSLSCPKDQLCTIEDVKTFPVGEKGAIQACKAYVDRVNSKKPGELDIIYYEGSDINIVNVGKACLKTQ